MHARSGDGIHAQSALRGAPRRLPRSEHLRTHLPPPLQGKLIKTNKIFASSFHTGSLPFSFRLGSDDVIEAWNKGLVGMCEGERRRLIVPWDLAYGAEGGKGVPPYSELQYDFELQELSGVKTREVRGHGDWGRGGWRCCQSRLARRTDTRLSRRRCPSPRRRRRRSRSFEARALATRVVL